MITKLTETEIVWFATILSMWWARQPKYNFVFFSYIIFLFFDSYFFSKL
jgi:hypothetical protein